MCGIFAYLNYKIERERRYILEVLFNGLRRLEYRGYDSSGIAIDAGECGSRGSASSPLVFRQEGKIESLVRSVYEEVDASNLNLGESFSVHAGIAHTRWATHGVPSPRNSHPQSSGTGHEFLVVHNGIITNYEVLKETLVRHGYTFESDTDTEVIPKLAKFVFDKANDEEGAQMVTFSQVVMEVMRHLEGAYALIFKSSHYPNELIACKRGSPLLLGIRGEAEKVSCGTSFQDANLLRPNGQPKELFLSSDANAVVEHTRTFMVLEDDEVIHLKALSLSLDGGVTILKYDPGKVEINGIHRPASVHRALSVLEMEVEQIMKGNYDHFMQKEIHEQPESLTTTMRGRLISGDSSKAKGVLLGGLKDHLKTIRRSRRIVFIGCGTSYNAALAARPFMEELSGVPVTMEIASDLLDREGPIYREDTVVFVSQSGETADTLQALNAIARETDCGVHINAGCEIGVASTKAYTSQIVVMTMVALALGGDTISSQARREATLDGLLDLPNKVREVLKLDDELKSLAKLLMCEQSLLVFGRGCNYATALEGALKVKEVALMHSEGILAGEMKHGPLALVDETLPIIVIATRDACFRKQQSVIQQLHARKGRLIVICSKGDASLVCAGGSCRVIEVPQVVDCLQPVINIVPLQLLAYHLTVLRGFNVDQPRNLAKSVTTQ
ncbi:Glutamine--fructose-6-phosphate aminotransferase [isomerizing] [Acorus calamus]|uniref:glutamine--fructose-6-phosphate transaminase (isomerizing) n=1 Tax=Acorus calamus TaxID=4465 RepID=A0AAV9F0L0_ACOCL|nr:Glutamine--fructose-6-phosphate aminotransferase [isomerizing] [Acorus calamus]